MKTKEAFLNMISDSLWGTQSSYSNVDFDAIAREAENQAVKGIILSQLPGVTPAEQYQLVSQFIRYTYAQREMVKLFEVAEIPVVILKGAAAAVYYPEPSMRSFGDIDFIVPGDCFAKSGELLIKNGFRVLHDEDNERHFGFSKDGITYELHSKFSYEDLDLEKYIIAGIDNRVVGQICEHEFPMLPSLANGLTLLVHMRQHLKSGLGLRQMIDWMMYCDKVLDDAFWEEQFQSVAESLHLTTLAVTATALCQKYLGLRGQTWCLDADEMLVDELLDNLFASGNFGCKQGRGNAVESVMTAFRREGFFQYLQKAGEHNWEAYHAHPRLRPFCWIYQIERYVRQGSSRKGKLKGDITRGNQRYELLRKLGIG